MRAMLAVVLFLSGIATAQAETLWRRADAAPGQSPTGPQAQAWLDRDMAQCEYEATSSATGRSDRYQPQTAYGRGSNALAGVLFREPAAQRLYDLCMRARGWQEAN